MRSNVRELGGGETDWRVQEVKKNGGKMGGGGGWEDIASGQSEVRHA